MRAVFIPGRHAAADAWISPAASFQGGVTYDTLGGSVLFRMNLDTLRGSYVDSATLRLFAVSWDGLSGMAAAAPILRTWDPWQATWLERVVGVPWAEPGGRHLVDFGEWSGASRLFAKGDQVIELDVTAEVRRWASGVRNDGWIIRGSVRIGGAKHPDSRARPSLAVRYSSPQAAAPAFEAGAPTAGGA